MDEVKLVCAVYDEAVMFSVKIAGDAKVEALQEAIFDKMRYKERYSFDASDLTLYLAKKNGVWLKSDRTLKPFLKKRRQEDRDYAEMIPNRTLDDDDYFGHDFQPGGKEIHVLVELPTQVAAPSDVIPSLPQTTLHRHPERLKRWAAINAMIRQKNQAAIQAANDMTKKEDKKTNKKRKNDDIDKSIGYASLCWEDIKPIYNFDDSYELQSSDIPDAVIELLLAHIRDLRELYGQISDGKEAKRLFFIAPILEAVSRLLGDVRILVEEDVVGRNVLLKGRFEFVLKRGTKRISTVQAKRENMLQGVVQNVTGLEALADVEDLTVAYGIVTNFLEWRFLISEDMKVRKHEYSLRTTNTIPSFQGLKEIVGKIYQMLTNEQSVSSI
ncbi:hypothetical protein AC1031_002473 [Aphanomyces cochlioides]|nr:hypothetical protein AC1031_002473 [Aphanomyces cochlioides]